MLSDATVMLGKADDTKRKVSSGHFKTALAVRKGHEGPQWTISAGHLNTHPGKLGLSSGSQAQERENKTNTPFPLK